MKYDLIKNMPTSRDGKMAYGIFAALIARSSLNSGIELLGNGDRDGAFFAFLTTGILLYTIGLAMVRFDTNRPLFEPLKARR